MDEQLRKWVEKKFGADMANVQLEELGELGISGEIAVWHPLDDLNKAPRVPLGDSPRIQAVLVGKNLAAYVLRVSTRVPTQWREVADASTDADRFFLTQTAQTDAVIDWFNEDPAGFENLGGGSRMEQSTHANGTRVVVIESPDGNARIVGGFTDAGELCCAILEV